MKTKRILIVLSLSLFGVNLFGHDQNVHQAITANAATSAMGESRAYENFVNVISSDLSYTGLNGAANAMIAGSFDEDFGPKDDKTGGYRSLNHFYDPLDNTYGKGLSDSVGFSGSGSIGDKRRFVGTNSFAWGSISNCMGINFSGVTLLGFAKNVNTSNTWSWPNARTYEWLGLTATNQLERQTYLLSMFRAVGQVMHLLEDTT